MIKLIVGHKGLGKTKTLIEMANGAVQSSNGNVVCVEKGLELTYDLDHRARLVDVQQYGVDCYDSYYGFICGLMAGNYDITHIFCDAVFKICGKDMEKLENFISRLNKLVVNQQTDIVMLISCEPEDLSAASREYIINA